MKNEPRAPAAEAAEISWIGALPEEQATGEVAAAFARARERLGFVPNVQRVFALRPRHYLAWLAYYEDLMRGESRLSVAEREMIAVVVSALNECHYCSTSHRAYLRVVGDDPDFPDRLAEDYRAAAPTPRARAILDYTVKITRDAHGCTPEDLSALRAAGLSDEEIVDVVEIASMFNLTNRLTSALGMVPNPEFHTLGRH